VPGIWFEFEVTNPGSAAWHETAHQLHRDGVPLQVGNRRFWDFRDPWVHDFMAERVLGRLREDGFGYLKIDYNDSIGPGVDGVFSAGENLRQHLAGVQRFLGRLRVESPGLVIENCSSGGHRLESSMMALTAMSSFSDAHETADIPLIAADLNRLVWSAQKQIWAVLRAEDTMERLAYYLAATFLGRMCLSGDLPALRLEGMALMRDAISLYQDVAPVIRDGIFRCVRREVLAYGHPTGQQVVTIDSPQHRRMLLIWHRFGGGSDRLELALPPRARWRLEREFGGPCNTGEFQADQANWSAKEWTGGVMVFSEERV
jgi:alpha-galactosidase